VFEQRQEEEWMDDLPTVEEINDTIAALRESAGGEDEVTILMIREAGEAAKEQFRRPVRQLWMTEPEGWETAVKRRVEVMLYKGEGDQTNLDNYRGIMLLSIISRVLGRVIATRIRRWQEEGGWLLNCQWGFRPHRFTMDVVFLVRVLVEMAAAVQG
jgi:hypothetical protein